MEIVRARVSLSFSFQQVFKVFHSVMSTDCENTLCFLITKQKAYMNILLKFVEAMSSYSFGNKYSFSNTSYAMINRYIIGN